jgi:hypothetical protein
VEGERAVERARYRFTISATRPFDQVYPRSVFEKKVAREVAEERVLRKFFGVSVTPSVLAAEFDRIGRSTKAPDQWAAIKKALGDDRHRIEEVFCRPLLVERALRAKFEFDSRIHAIPHRRAREARSAFLSGKIPAGTMRLLLSRDLEVPATTAEMLERARAESSTPHAIAPPSEEKEKAPHPAGPEIAAVLERELQKPGDVTTILEERDRFSVFRLKEKTEKTWTVDAVTLPKVDFNTWFERVRRSD